MMGVCVGKSVWDYGQSTRGSACVSQSLGPKQSCHAVLCRESRVWKGEDPGPGAPRLVSPAMPQAPTYPLRGLLRSTGSWQERAEKPVPKQHPRCLDPLLPLSVDQEHRKALDRRVRTRPRKVGE